METFEEIVADRKRWVPFRKATFAGLDSFKPRDIEEQIAESKKVRELRNAFATIVKIGEETDMPPKLFQAIIRTAMTKWAEANDPQLLDYLFLKMKLAIVFSRFMRSKGDKAGKLKELSAKFYVELAELEQSYRPAEAIMEYWNFFK